MTWQTARGYCWARALRMLGERPGTTLLAVVFAGLAIALPGCLFMFAQSVWPVVGSQPVAELSAFVEPGATAADVKALTGRLAAMDGVAAVRLITRQQAWNELQRRAKDPQALPEFKANALPDVLVAEFAPGVAPSVVESAMGSAAKLARVESVQGDVVWYRRLASLSRLGRHALVPLGAMVGFLVLAVVLGVVRVAATIEPSELRLLEQIGAEPEFMRRPFVYAGAVTLGIAAAVSLGLVAAVRLVAAPTLAELGREFGLVLVVGYPPWPVIVAFFAGCVLTGAGAAYYFAGRSIARALA
jgi:cell division transport system permease protein